MTATATKPRFDPAAHLTKQGWKGKGTALKHGHIVRPIAVVQKKSLSGIGKDRDEATPFWDQLFSSTAATLFPTPTGSASPAPTPTPSSSPGPSSWATLSHLDAGRHHPAPKPKQRVELRMRINQESAKRGLYGRFVAGVVLKQEETKWEQKVPGLENVVVEAGPSDSPEVMEGNGGEEEKGSKEEKRARKEEKARRRAEREARRKRKAAALVDAGGHLSETPTSENIGASTAEVYTEKHETLDNKSAAPADQAVNEDEDEDVERADRTKKKRRKGGNDLPDALGKSKKKRRKDDKRSTR